MISYNCFHVESEYVVHFKCASYFWIKKINELGPCLWLNRKTFEITEVNEKYHALNIK